MGLLTATSALLEFIFGPMWGRVSDRRGRKPVLMIGLVGYAVSSFLFGVSTELWMLFASRALSGVLSSATITSAMAYVGDVTPSEERGGGMGKIGAAMALGLMLGPGLGGLLAKPSLSLPFFISAGMSILGLILVAFLLPESLQPGSRVVEHRKSNLWQAAVGPAGVLLLLVALFSFALTNFKSIFGLYALERFSFSPDQVGSVLMVVAVVSTAGKAILTGPVTRRWGEAATIKFSLLAGSVGFLVLLLAWDFTTVLITTGFFIISKTLLRPAALALISKTSQRDQGALMGLTNSFMSLGRIAGPIWAGFVFDLNPLFPYLSGSLFMLIGFGVSLLAIKASATRPSTQWKRSCSD